MYEFLLFWIFRFLNKNLFLSVPVWFWWLLIQRALSEKQELHKLFEMKTHTGDKSSTTGLYVRILPPSVKKLKLFSTKMKRLQTEQDAPSQDGQQLFWRLRTNRSHRSLGLSAYIFVSWMIKLYARNTFAKSIILVFLWFIDTA